MSTTIQTDRPATQVQAPRIERPVPTVPDHVPPEVAAQHPDAAAVVSAPPQPRQRGGVRVVGRGEQRPAWALRILGLVACAALAAAAGSSDDTRAAPVAVTEPAATTTAPPAVTASEATQPQGCAPGASVVVRCEPPCPTPALLEFPWQPCPSRTSTGGR